jgi:NAD(P)-dependent dehydrogenase (short-subunit alcohol dehydrogenase family)
MKKSVFITGATSGIGKACAQIFGHNGYRVFATYRNTKDAEALRRIHNVYPIKMDVTEAQDIHNAFREVSDLTGRNGLYAIVNNAGITYTAPFEFADEERAAKVMEVNVMAPYKIVRTFLPLLQQYGRTNEVKARVINIASWAGQMGQPFIPFYNASKAALIALTESMYYDLGLLGIHAVLASPGITKTPLLEKATRDGVDNLQGFPEERRRFYQPYFDHYTSMSANSHNMKFFPTPEKVATKLYKIAEAKHPKFKYNLALDALFIDTFLTRFIPFGWRSVLTKRMFKLNT